MDRIDKRLLALLLEDSRTPMSMLARRLRVSREVVQYRIERLRQQGIIRSFFADIDLSRFGYIGAAFFLVIKAARHDEMRSYLEHVHYISWAAEWSGNYSIGMTIVGKSLEEIDRRVQSILSRFNDVIIAHQFILHRQNHFFYEKYVGERVVPIPKKRLIPHKLSDADYVILKRLSENSRTSAVDLAQSLKMSGVAIAKRIRKLEDAGYIRGYSIFIDITKLKLYQYSIFIDNRELQDLNLLKAYLAVHPAVNFIAEYVGDQFFEFGVFVNEPYALKPILLSIEQKFPQYTFTTIALLQREFISTAPPRCVFE